jgi:hypothetical protein
MKGSDADDFQNMNIAATPLSAGRDREGTLATTSAPATKSPATSESLPVTTPG